MKKLLRTLPLLSVLLVGCGALPGTKTTSPTTTAPVVEKMVYSDDSGVTITYMNDRKPMEKIYGSLVTFFSPQ
jgi:hypothetical protein